MLNTVYLLVFGQDSSLWAKLTDLDLIFKNKQFSLQRYLLDLRPVETKKEEKMMTNDAAVAGKPEVVLDGFEAKQT